MDELRLGDVIDDYCIKCRRLTNHAIVSLMDGQVAKVRCRSCYHDHNYLHEQAPPSKKDLKKAELFNAVLSGSGVEPSVAQEAVGEEAGDGIAAALESEPIDSDLAPVESAQVESVEPVDETPATKKTKRAKKA